MQETARDCFRIERLLWFAEYMCGIEQPIITYRVDSRQYVSMAPDAGYMSSDPSRQHSIDTEVCMLCTSGFKVFYSRSKDPRAPPMFAIVLVSLIKVLSHNCFCPPNCTNGTCDHSVCMYVSVSLDSLRPNKHGLNVKSDD